MIQIYKDLKEEDAFIPYKSSMRLWKFKLQNNKFINLHIPNKTRLINYLEKYQPKDVWFTNGLFLNAKNLEKSTYKTRLIKKNLVFDLDDVNINEINKLLDILKPYLLELEYIINTSENSYQISFKNDYDKEIVEEVIKQGIKIDKKIYDEKRVIRCPLTYHHSGYFIDFIDSPLDLDDRQESLKSNETRHFPLKEIKKKENLPNPSSKLYIPTYVNGVNGKAILYLRFKGKSLDYIENEMRRLDKIYHLGIYFIRVFNNEIDIICPRVFEIARLKKIYRDKKSGIKYFDISKKLGPDDIIEHNFVDYDKYNYSRPHLKYINKFLTKLIPSNLKQIGENNPTLILGK